MSLKRKEYDSYRSAVMRYAHKLQTTQSSMERVMIEISLSDRSRNTETGRKIIDGSGELQVKHKTIKRRP